MKKYLYQFLYPIARIYWSIFQPVTLGVRLMLINNNQIFLVRHTYFPGQFWMMPGGGVGRGEDYQLAIKRELQEELNIKIKNTKLLGIFHSRTEGKRDNAILFLSEDKIDQSTIVIDPAEIIECGFFPINQLPKNISPGHRRRITDFINKNYPNCGEW